MSTTRQLRIAGQRCACAHLWLESRREIPHESQFRAPSPSRRPLNCHRGWHESLIESTQRVLTRKTADRPHLADSTEIEAREKPSQGCFDHSAGAGSQAGQAEEGRATAAAGADAAGAASEYDASRNAGRSAAGLHTVGARKTAKGHKETWVGYKLHLDVADGQIR